MTRRLVRSIVLALAAAVALSAFSRVEGQAKVPRAADGHPSLEGTWSYATLTPVERPAAYENRASIPLAEARKFEQDTISRNNADRRDSDPAADVARAYNDAWYDRGARMTVIDGQARTSLIVDPPDGRIPALTPEAQRRVAARAESRRQRPADGPEDRSLAERCLQFNAGPPMISSAYNNNVQIFQTRDHVVIVNEMIHDARVVPTNNRPHLAAAVRRWQGDSVGRWDGDTFVVDTTNFTDKTPFRGSGPNLHLVERFTRVGPDTLLYEFSIDDPESFTRPWKAVAAFTRTDEPTFEYACHEGNHGMVGMLKGQRAEDKGTQGR